MSFFNIKNCICCSFVWGGFLLAIRYIYLFTKMELFSSDIFCAWYSKCKYTGTVKNDEKGAVDKLSTLLSALHDGSSLQ